MIKIIKLLFKTCRLIVIFTTIMTAILLPTIIAYTIGFLDGQTQNVVGQPKYEITRKQEKEK